MKYTLVVAILTLTACGPKKPYKTTRTSYVCSKTIRVKEIGACTAKGDCGVIDENGNHAVTYLPVKGAEVCIERKFVEEEVWVK